MTVRRQSIEKFLSAVIMGLHLRAHGMKLLKQQASFDVRKFFFSQRVVKDLLFQEVMCAASVNQFKNCLVKFWHRYRCYCYEICIAHKLSKLESEALV